VDLDLDGCWKYSQLDPPTKRQKRARLREEGSIAEGAGNPASIREEKEWSLVENKKGKPGPSRLTDLVQETTALTSMKKGKTVKEIPCGAVHEWQSSQRNVLSTGGRNTVCRSKE